MYVIRSKQQTMSMMSKWRNLRKRNHGTQHLWDSLGARFALGAQSAVLRPGARGFGPKWDFSGCHYVCCVNACFQEKLKKRVLMYLLVSCVYMMHITYIHVCVYTSWVYVCVYTLYIYISCGCVFTYVCIYIFLVYIYTYIYSLHVCVYIYV